ncbi:MAG: hypothetical protein WC626_09000 [Methanoregula sp.]
MQLRKIGVVLLALLLAAMATVPLVSADEKSQVHTADEMKIRELFKPIDKEIHLIISEESLVSNLTGSEKPSNSVSKILSKYDKNLENIIELLDKNTNVYLDNTNRSLLKRVIITEHFKRVSNDMVLEKRGLKIEDAIILKPTILGIVNNTNDINRIQRESLRTDTFILAQSSPDIYGGTGIDDAGLPYSVEGNNNLYQVMTWQSSPVTYRLCYNDEDHPYPNLNVEYDAYRRIQYGTLLDYAQFEVSSSDIHYSLSWSDSRTYGYPAGNHGNVYRPKGMVMYVANIWNHDISTTNNNPGMGQIVMSVPYIPQ